MLLSGLGKLKPEGLLLEGTGKSSSFFTLSLGNPPNPEFWFVLPFLLSGGCWGNWLLFVGWGKSFLFGLGNPPWLLFGFGKSNWLLLLLILLLFVGKLKPELFGKSSFDGFGKSLLFPLLHLHLGNQIDYYYYYY